MMDSHYITTTENKEEVVEEEIFSSEDQISDYLSITGLNTRFNLDGKDFDIFIIKELMDNALDFIESNAKEFVNGKRPFIDVIITQEENDAVGEVTKIIIRNSNGGINNIFTDERINKIFNLNEYYSSKKYRHKINRGELGDAFKAILCIPYAIAVDNADKNNNKYKNWDYPLEINVSNDNRSIKIKIDNIDKIRRNEKVEVEKKYDPLLYHNNNNDNDNKNQINYYDDDHFTEIVVYLPNIAVNYRKIKGLVNKYIVFNTHIDFDIHLPPLYQHPFYYQATQKIKNDWKNKMSIYYYSLTEFKHLIHSLEKNKDNLNIYDNFIHTNFREGWRLKRDEFFETLTYGDLKKDDRKIEETYKKLKDTSISPLTN